MKILFVGDVVGRPGRTALRLHLDNVIKQYDIDFTIVNGENSAHGKGITEKIFKEIIGYGADVVTMGNHTYSKVDIYDIVDDKRLIVPLNMEMPEKASGYQIFDVLNKKVLVANLCTEAFMHNIIRKTFEVSDEIVKVEADIKIIDLHGEATAEKVAYLHNYKKSFTGIFGTHTHIQTADEDVFDGCGYISDAGMCGAYESIIGRDIKEVLDRIKHDTRTHYTVSKGDPVFCAVVLEVCESSNRAINIERIQIRP